MLCCCTGCSVHAHAHIYGMMLAQSCCDCLAPYQGKRPSSRMPWQAHMMHTRTHTRNTQMHTCTHGNAQQTKAHLHAQRCATHRQACARTEMRNTHRQACAPPAGPWATGRVPPTPAPLSSAACAAGPCCPWSERCCTWGMKQLGTCAGCRGCTQRSGRRTQGARSNWGGRARPSLCVEEAHSTPHRAPGNGVMTETGLAGPFDGHQLTNPVSAGHAICTSKVKASQRDVHLHAHARTGSCPAWTSTHINKHGVFTQTHTRRVFAPQHTHFPSAMTRSAPQLRAL